MSFLASVRQDKQEEFYKAVAGLGANAAAEQVESYTHSETHEESFIEGGTFLPLGAWQAKGFDVVAIESRSHASDVVMHPVLGKTYRVRLLSTAHTAKRTLHRDSTVSKRAKKIRVTPEVPHGTDDEASPQLAIEDRDASSSSSSSSLRSSSSSSSDDKKNKKKKSKKSKSSKGKKDKKSKKKHKKDERKGKRDKKGQAAQVSCPKTCLPRLMRLGR